MDCDRKRLKCAISAAATSAAGLLQIQEDASKLKAYNVSQAAATGVSAAYIGSTGLLGPDDILGGDRGMLALHSSTIVLDKLTEQMNYYEIERIYVKPYAACRHCHSAMEAAIFLSKEFKRPYDMIQQITVNTYSLAIRGHDHTKVRGVESAKLSMPYSVAAAYVLECGDLDAFSIVNIKNQNIQHLAAKVKIFENPEYSARSPQKRIAEVHIKFKDGMEVEKRIDYAKGEPENPMSNNEIITKFESMMEWCGRSDKGKIILDIFSGKEMIVRDFIQIL